jgi:NADH dehydrogenase
MKRQIVIAGEGSAGLYAAEHLDQTIARHADVEVVLINDQNFTLFTPLLHEVAAGDLYPGDNINPLRRIQSILKVN